MKDTEDMKKNKELSKQECMSKSEKKSLCNELLSSDEDVEKADYQIIHDIEGEHLFKILETPEGFTLVVGTYRMSEKFKTKQQAENAVKEKSWELITNVVGLVLHIYREKNGN